MNANSTKKRALSLRSNNISSHITVLQNNHTSCKRVKEK